MSNKESTKTSLPGVTSKHLLLQIKDPGPNEIYNLPPLIPPSDIFSHLPLGWHPSNIPTWFPEDYPPPAPLLDTVEHLTEEQAKYLQSAFRHRSITKFQPENKDNNIIMEFCGDRYIIAALCSSITSGWWEKEKGWRYQDLGAEGMQVSDFVIFVPCARVSELRNYRSI